MLSELQASIFGANDGKGHSLVYYFGLPEGWDLSMVDNNAAVRLLQRLVHDGTEADGYAYSPSPASREFLSEPFQKQKQFVVKEQFSHLMSHKLGHSEAGAGVLSKARGIVGWIACG